MKPLQVVVLVAVAGVAAVGGGLFVKWQSSQNAPSPPAAVASAPVAQAPPAPTAAAQPEQEQPVQPAEPKPSPLASAEPRKHRVRRARQAQTVAANQTPAVAVPVPPTAPVESPKPEPPAPEPAAPVAQVQAEAPVPVPAPPPPPPAPRQVTLKAGTLIPARTIEALSSDRNQAGDTFTATLDEPLVVDGLVIAERGAHLEGKIVRSERAGKVKGLADLEIELTQLNTSDGQRVEIATETFQKHGETSKGEDAAKVGVGAVLGAAIGAIAGGGKGAGIGAGVGGAAGAGDVMLTRGKPVQLKSETRINFRLRNSVTITERTGRA